MLPQRPCTHHVRTTRRCREQISCWSLARHSHACGYASRAVIVPPRHASRENCQRAGFGRRPSVMQSSRPSESYFEGLAGLALVFSRGKSTSACLRPQRKPSKLHRPRNLASFLCAPLLCRRRRRRAASR